MNTNQHAIIAIISRHTPIMFSLSYIPYSYLLHTCHASICSHAKVMQSCPNMHHQGIHTHHIHTYREITVHMHLHKLGIILSNCFIDLPEGKLVGLVTAIVTVEVTKEKRLQNIKKTIQDKHKYYYNTK